METLKASPVLLVPGAGLGKVWAGWVVEKAGKGLGTLSRHPPPLHKAFTPARLPHNTQKLKQQQQLALKWFFPTGMPQKILGKKHQMHLRDSQVLELSFKQGLAAFSSVPAFFPRQLGGTGGLAWFCQSQEGTGVM